MSDANENALNAASAASAGDAREARTFDATGKVSIDADVLEWFKARGEEYERLINAVLRKYVQLHEQKLL